MPLRLWPSTSCRAVAADQVVERRVPSRRQAGACTTRSPIAGEFGVGWGSPRRPVEGHRGSPQPVWVWRRWRDCRAARGWTNRGASRRRRRARHWRADGVPRRREIGDSRQRVLLRIWWWARNCSAGSDQCSGEFGRVEEERGTQRHTGIPDVSAVAWEIEDPVVPMRNVRVPLPCRLVW